MVHQRRQFYRNVRDIQRQQIPPPVTAIGADDPQAVRRRNIWLAPSGLHFPTICPVQFDSGQFRFNLFRVIPQFSFIVDRCSIKKRQRAALTGSSGLCYDLATV
jgi:hypothetical protein